MMQEFIWYFIVSINNRHSRAGGNPAVIKFSIIYLVGQYYLKEIYY